jgi:hypothetical protein
MIRKGSQVQFNPATTQGNPVLSKAALAGTKFKVKSIVGDKAKPKALLDIGVAYPVQCFIAVPQKKGKTAMGKAVVVGR